MSDISHFCICYNSYNSMLTICWTDDLKIFNNMIKTCLLYNKHMLWTYYNSMLKICWTYNIEILIHIEITRQEVYYMIPLQNSLICFANKDPKNWGYNFETHHGIACRFVRLVWSHVHKLNTFSIFVKVYMM